MNVNDMRYDSFLYILKQLTHVKYKKYQKYK